MAVERERPWESSIGCRVVVAVCRGTATAAMIYEFAAEAERLGQRANALKIEQIGDDWWDRLLRMNADPPPPGGI